MTRIPDLTSEEIRALMPAGMVEGYKTLVSSMWHDGTLDTRLRELLRMQSAEICDCKRCAHVRFTEAQDEGVTEQELSELRNPAASATLTEREQTALMYAELLSTAPDGITDGLFNEMRRWFTDAQIVELSFFVLTYNMLQRFNSAIDLDPYAGTDLIEKSIEVYRYGVPA